METERYKGIVRRKVRQQNILFVLSFMSLWNLGTLRASLAEHLSDRCSDSNPTWSRLTSAVGDAGYCMLGCWLLGSCWGAACQSSVAAYSALLFSTVVGIISVRLVEKRSHRTPVLPEVYRASHAHEVYTHTLRFRRTRRTRRTRAVVSLHIPPCMVVFKAVFCGILSPSIERSLQ